MSKKRKIEKGKVESKIDQVVVSDKKLPKSQMEVKEEIEKHIREDEIVEIYEMPNRITKKPGQMYVFSVEKSEYSLMSLGGLSEDKSLYMGNNNIIRHPENRELMSVLAEKEPNHASAIEIKSLAVALPGWKVTTDKNGKAEKFLKTPNLDLFERIDDVCRKLQYDIELYDDAYCEIKKIGNEPDEVSLYHTPARYIYIEAKRRTNGSYIYGAVKRYHQITDILMKSNYKSFYPIRRDTEIKNGISYIAGIKGYTPRSGYYGLPIYISAIGSIMENIIIKKYIYSFFENNASPALAITITGANIGERNRKAIKDHLDKMKGVPGAYSTLILAIPDTTAKIDIKEIQESLDGDFLKEREMNRTEILQSHIVPPKLLGISDTGGISSGSEMIGAMKEFLEVVVKPKQLRLESIIDKIIEKLFGFSPGFKFNKYDITNERDMAVVFQILSKIVDNEGNPAMTVQEIREKYGFPREISGNKMNVSGASLNDDNDTTRATVPGVDTNASGDPITNIDIGTSEGGK